MILEALDADQNKMIPKCKPAVNSALSWLSKQTKNLVDPMKVTRGKPLDPAKVYSHFTCKSLSPVTGMFSCMDFKGQRPIIGTPGGDFGEFLLGYHAWAHLNKKEDSYEDVKKTMAEFIMKYCSVSRPFYKHTDAARLKSLVSHLGAKEFPVESAPANKEGWLESLCDPEVHGCGHLRSMLTQPTAYGINQSFLRSIVMAFYDLYWDPTMSKMTFLEVLPDPADLNLESGLVIHDHCSTAFTPYKEGSGYFALDLPAQRLFRHNVIGPFFAAKAPTVNMEDLLKQIEERYFQYWKVTGGYLNLLSVPILEIKQEGYISVSEHYDPNMQK